MWLIVVCKISKSYIKHRNAPQTFLSFIRHHLPQAPVSITLPPVHLKLKSDLSR